MRTSSSIYTEERPEYSGASCRTTDSWPEEDEQEHRHSDQLTDRGSTPRPGHRRSGLRPESRQPEQASRGGHPHIGGVAGHYRAEGPRRGEPIPARLPADTPVFYVPTGLIRILDRDLKAAGIPKWDERGRTVDVHAMRTSFGTLLSKGGVAPRTAQAAMRHSTINLTMNTYTDPKLLDVHGALDVLPNLPLDGGTQSERNAVSATGTDDLPFCSLAPTLAPNTDETRTLQSTVDKAASESKNLGTAASVDVSACPVKRKDSLTTAVNESSRWAMADLNHRHPRCKRGALTN